MAGHVRYTVLLDANVLFPVAVCDALISVGATGIFAPKWTQRIEGEWIRNLEAKKGVPPGTFNKRRDDMRVACPDWEVPEEGWAPLESGLYLPDAGDRHVLAAAIAGHADCIVTLNLRDFPKQALSPFGIEVLHPDAFLIAQLELEPFRVLPAFKRMRARATNPPHTPEAFAEAMDRNGLSQTAACLRAASELI